jgi:hypothetical protein
VFVDLLFLAFDAQKPGMGSNKTLTQLEAQQFALQVLIENA